MSSAVIYHFSLFFFFNNHYGIKAKYIRVETQGHKPACSCSASSTCCAGSPYTQLMWFEISWPKKTVILTFRTSPVLPSPRLGVSQPRESYSQCDALLDSHKIEYIHSQRLQASIQVDALRSNAAKVLDLNK